MTEEDCKGLEKNIQDFRRFKGLECAVKHWRRLVRIGQDMNVKDCH